MGGSLDCMGTRQDDAGMPRDRGAGADAEVSSHPGADRIVTVVAASTAKL